MKIVNVTTETLRHKWGDTTRDSVILNIESLPLENNEYIITTEIEPKNLPCRPLTK